MVARNIVSYSLFQHAVGGTWRSDIPAGGSLAGYARFLPTLLRAHHALWSGWTLRLHHSEELLAHTYYPALLRMRAAGLLELEACGSAPSVCGAMLWRMRPAFDGADRVVVCADIDSFPCLKQRLCVEGFRSSPHAVMLTHDCETHDGVLGGGIAVKSARFRQLLGGVSSFDAFTSLRGRKIADLNFYSADELYLKRHVWPLVKAEALIYSSSGRTQLACRAIRRNVDGIDLPADLHPQVVERGNSFNHYIGCSGYDLLAARVFLDGLDLPAIKQITACEAVT